VGVLVARDVVQDPEPRGGTKIRTIATGKFRHSKTEETLRTRECLDGLCPHWCSRNRGARLGECIQALGSARSLERTTSNASAEQPRRVADFDNKLSSV